MAGEVAQIQTTAVVMVPVAPASVPANSLYSDASAAGAFANKTPGGTVVQVVSAASDLMLKQKQNLSGETISQGQPVALKSDGSVARADSDTPAVSELIGFAMENILDGATGSVLLIGPNVPGAVTGLGFAPKDPVFLSENRTYTNTLAGYTGGDDRIIRVGFADCAPGSASSTATDLIVSYEIITDAP
jgi:hypothetical protein